ncbi:MAG: hypothetical protein JWO08_3112 [Verrucomicrobiaceae bacterium]|nr:hypothetical protein [Verrucomicrobiaceae bacterium]
MRIVKGTGYAAYQCSEVSTKENTAGQIVRLAIFNILNPTATARWLDVCGPGESSNGITLANTFVSGPILHVIADKTVRIFFSSRIVSDTAAAFRVLYKDLDVTTGMLSGLQQARCTVSKKPETADLAQPTVQSHLDFLFGPGAGANFSKGISLACDMVPFDGALYSTVQIKNSANGKTLLLTNVLMRSRDEGATWELLGAPDPKLLSGDEASVKILAEPAMTQDSKNIYLHLRSNTPAHGYVMSKASKQDLYTFGKPLTKWGFGVGRPATCDFGKPIGIVAMFTAPTMQMGGEATTRNRCDVVMIDRSYSRYSLAFPIVDYNAVNTPFICAYNDEMYVLYSTGKRRLTPKFGTSEIVFSKLRREFFVPVKNQPDAAAAPEEDRR